LIYPLGVLKQRRWLSLLGGAFLLMVAAGRGRLPLWAQVLVLSSMLVAWILLRQREARLHGLDRVRPTRRRLLWAAAQMGLLGLVWFYPHERFPPFDARYLLRYAFGVFVLGGGVLELCGVLPPSLASSQPEVESESQRHRDDDPLDPLRPARWAVLGSFGLVGLLALGSAGFNLYRGQLINELVVAGSSVVTTEATERFEDGGDVVYVSGGQLARLKALDAWSEEVGSKLVAVLVGALAVVLLLGLLTNGRFLRNFCRNFLREFRRF
jgi:hypothetical protein